MDVDFLHLPRCWRGRVGRGLDRREPGRSGWKPPVRQPRPLNAANVASARGKSKLRNPRNPSRPGEDSGARERRAKPLPTLPHTEAVANAKRKRRKGPGRRYGRGGSCDFAQDDKTLRSRKSAMNQKKPRDSARLARSETALNERLLLVYVQAFARWPTIVTCCTATCAWP
jgi:hypothetical protein